MYMLKLQYLISNDYSNFSSGRALDPWSQGRAFDSHLGPGIVSLSKALISVA